MARVYESLLANHGVPVPQRPYYLKWLRYYLDFCRKYGLPPSDRRSFPAFDGKLREKNQSDDQRRQARQAMAPYYRGILPNSAPASPVPVPPRAVQGSGESVPLTKRPTTDAAPREPTRATPIQPLRPPRAQTRRPAHRPLARPSPRSGRKTRFRRRRQAPLPPGGTGETSTLKA